MKIIIELKGENIKPSLQNIPVFTPENAAYPWDNIEIHPVKEIQNGIFETVDEGNEDFWSIYLHCLHGELECIADVSTKYEAKQLAQLIDNATNYRVYSNSY